MLRTFPQFRFHWNYSGGLVWHGYLQPTPESPRYLIRITHNPGLPPKVLVLGYDVKSGCNHLYPDSSLCLYWPKEWWWTPGESLTATLVPWTAFWLYYYELWEATGRWFGPSSPHGLQADE
jgi:hypothetical protein